MNYIKELNAFRDWLLTNELPTRSITLWHTLMSVNNMARWRQVFNAPNSVLQHLTGLSKSGLHSARVILVEAGLIHYTPGTKGTAPTYEMISLCKQATDLLEVKDTGEHLQEDKVFKSSEVTPKRRVIKSELGARDVEMTLPQAVTSEQVTPEPSTSRDQLEDQSENGFKHWSPDGSSDEDLIWSQTGTILKQNKKKQIDDVVDGREGHLIDLIKTYEMNIGKLNPFLKQELSKWVTRVGEHLVLAAIKQASLHNAETFNYVVKILEEWQEHEVTCPEDIAQHSAKMKASKAPRTHVRGVTQTTKQSLFDELRLEQEVEQEA